jgi:hypothetical protein
MSDFQNLGGWVDDPRGVEQAMTTLPFPVFADVRSAIRGTGRGKKFLTYDIIRKVAGKFPVRNQKIGDCVSMGAAGAVDGIKAIDIYINKEFEEWVAETATEDIYYGSRNIIGKGQLGNSDGSLGVWAAKYINLYGSVARQKYGDIDLSTYDGNRAKEWGSSRFRMPSSFMDVAKKHPVKTISQVKEYEEVIDLIYNGYTVTIASNQGFSSKRDSEGFAKPEGKWAHQMWICAMDDEYKRPGVCVQNSWGPNWIAGPKRHDQPDGSFWVDAEEIEKRVLKTGDCWAFSGYEGFKPQKINTRII